MKINTDRMSKVLTFVFIIVLLVHLALKFTLQSVYCTQRPGWRCAHTVPELLVHVHKISDMRAGGKFSAHFQKTLTHVLVIHEYVIQTHTFECCVKM